MQIKIPAKHDKTWPEFSTLVEADSMPYTPSWLSFKTTWLKVEK
jgi:hypothetical protein